MRAVIFDMQGTVYSHDSNGDNEVTNRLYESKTKGNPKEAIRKEKESILKGISGDENELQVYEIPNAVKTIMSYVNKGYKLVFVSFSDVNTVGEVLKLKKEVLGDILKGKQRENLHILEANALEMDAISKALEFFDLTKPIMIVNEGLLSYFDNEEKTKLSEIIKEMLSKSGGVWITSDPAMHNERRKGMYGGQEGRQKIEEKVKKMTGRSYDELSFDNEEKTDEFYTSLGLKIEKYPFDDSYPLVSLNKVQLEPEVVKGIKENISNYAKCWAFSV